MDASNNPLRAGLETERVAPPCTVVIFGASGDLTHRKLIPALYNLAVSRLLGPGTSVLGFARRPSSDEKFRESMREATEKYSRRKPLDPAIWKEFSQSLSYFQADYDDPNGFTKLRAKLDEIDAARGTRGNRLFYLSTPPDAFGMIVENLARAELIPPAKDTSRFSRVILEKPLGTDLESSRQLDRVLHGALDESQIFRIDHYLGKEAVQNILAFRFANSIFEPMWNREYVDHVQITAAEDIGLEGRGKFYETAGVTRDIIQNHLLQLLMVTAMEPPTAFDANAVRDEKVKVLKALRPIKKEDVSKLTVRGQYGPGFASGEAVVGYRQEPDVAPNSRVETFAAMKLQVDSWRWGGVPFYIRAGKRLAKRVTEIVVNFKQIPIALFRNAGSNTQPNALVMRIQPDEGITLRFASKVPGPNMVLRDVNMDFRYGTTYGDTAPEAYERLLLDAMLGDATLFARSDEVDHAWQFISPILHTWAEQPPPEFPNYAAGSWGPKASDELIARDGQEWRRP